MTKFFIYLIVVIVVCCNAFQGINKNAYRVQCTSISALSSDDVTLYEGITEQVINEIL